MSQPNQSSGVAAALRALSLLDAEAWELTLRQSALSVHSSPADQPASAVLGLLAQLAAACSAVQDPVRRATQQLLDAMAGRRFGDLSDSKAVARGTQGLLTRLGLRVVCPKAGCGQPATLRCAAAGNSKSGVFQFDHSAGPKRTTHLGSTTFPQLTLTDAPVDRRRSDRAS